MKLKIEKDGVITEIDSENTEELESLGIKVGNTKSKKKKTKADKIKAKIVGITPIISTALFLFLGFQFGAWHPAWLLFFSTPVISIILYAFNSDMRANIISVTSLICTCTYLILGLCPLHLWHPTWLIFFLVPIVSIIVGKDK